MIDTNIDAIEKLHLSFLKGLLKVRKQTPTLAVYGELRRHPVAVDFENKSLKFWLRVSNRKDGDLARKNPRYPAEPKQQGSHHMVLKHQEFLAKT